LHSHLPEGPEGNAGSRVVALGSAGLRFEWPGRWPGSESSARANLLESMLKALGNAPLESRAWPRSVRLAHAPDLCTSHSAHAAMQPGLHTKSLQAAGAAAPREQPMEMEKCGGAAFAGYLPRCSSPIVPAQAASGSCPRGTGRIEPGWRSECQSTVAMSTRPGAMTGCGQNWHPTRAAFQSHWTR